MSRVSVVFFRFHSDKKYRRGNVLLLRSFRDSENLMLNTKISRFLEKNLLSHSTGILRRRTLLFHKFLWYRKWKNSWIRGGGRREKEGVSRFSVEFSLSHRVEKKVESFSVSLFSGIEKC